MDQNHHDSDFDQVDLLAVQTALEKSPVWRECAVEGHKAFSQIVGLGPQMYTVRVVMPATPEEGYVFLTEVCRIAGSSPELVEQVEALCEGSPELDLQIKQDRIDLYFNYAPSSAAIMEVLDDEGGIGGLFTAMAKFFAQIASPARPRLELMASGVALCRLSHVSGYGNA